MVIELKNDKLIVQFSELGGALTSIKDKDGVEYLWQGNPEYWSGQAPVLFPICGSVRGNEVLLEGKIRNIPRHGLVRKENFTYKKIDDTAVSFSYRATEKTLKEYPYNFELTIVYRLKDSTVITEYQVKNNDDKKMPYFIGGHPGFNCPLAEGTKYEDYYLEFSEVETTSVPETFPETGLLDTRKRTPFLENTNRLDLDYSLFSHDAITLDKLKSRSVSLKSSKTDKGLRVDFQDFPNLILWSTTNKSPFIALEPWSGLSTSLEESDNLVQKRQVTFVEPGETSVKSFDITIL
ncbi:aldose 1-epimerase family protein [Gemelliphila palaticanis]|uniref:Aldose 1-epimerase family protein n=1 Tax=Gemelliphila palaticanis TaxID=81950 RepID=A0ABX2SXF3_9BACL|nr:aldose 1-epimerase family protein [Gemella palaticanis]MBF0714992.1 aldose 1-epimerase family protein [Gemella palaticanis]NYS46922.1 aldose 1-epimerase family protein [Gemella palaticanis]